MVSALILAAGRAAESAFSVIGNQPVLQWVLQSALAADFAEVICVTGDLTAVRRHFSIRDRRLSWLLSMGADGGRAAALWASDPQTDGVIFLAGDRMPAPTELINALIARFEQSRAWIVAPGSDAEDTSPVLFHRDLFGELLALPGDRNERCLVEAHPGQVVLVDWQPNTWMRKVTAKQRRARLKGSP